MFQHGDCGLPSATCEPVTKRGRRLVFSDRREDGGLSQQQHSSRGSRAGMSEHSLPDLLCDGPCYLLCATHSSAGCVLVETFVVTGIRREPAVPVANLAKGAGLASRPSLLSLTVARAAALAARFGGPGSTTDCLSLNNLHLHHQQPHPFIFSSFPPTTTAASSPSSIGS